jgi:hypothetical protein
MLSIDFVRTGGSGFASGTSSAGSAGTAPAAYAGSGTDVQRLAWRMQDLMRVPCIRAREQRSRQCHWHALLCRNAAQAITCEGAVPTMWEQLALHTDARQYSST